MLLLPHPTSNYPLLLLIIAKKVLCKEIQVAHGWYSTQILRKFKCLGKSVVCKKFLAVTIIGLFLLYALISSKSGCSGHHSKHFTTHQFLRKQQNAGM